jgi:hypothetical protein
MGTPTRLLALALLAAPSARAADGGAPPPDVVDAVRARLPGATVLSSSAACALGPARARAYGVLAQAREKTDEDPLRIAVVVADGPGWKVTVLQRRLEAKHAAGDVLFPYWDPRQGYTGKLEIRCTSPKADPDIGIDANGEFLGTFAAKLPREVRHLCFTADDVYNSWGCWTVNAATGAVEPSFLQLNAD